MPIVCCSIRCAGWQVVGAGKSVSNEAPTTDSLPLKSCAERPGGVQVSFSPSSLRQCYAGLPVLWLVSGVLYFHFFHNPIYLIHPSGFPLEKHGGTHRPRVQSLLGFATSHVDIDFSFTHFCITPLSSVVNYLSEKKCYCCS